ncbi:hypothetical protein [Aggregatibacter aphrophilus]|uniref:hypothetical protein n=1 Tax=Aggregatibacter aphrophilus TaxID=732 RepID=UPI0005C70EFB|nr:hypothetical protein [Aggregatibacter aphrophilus]
MKRFIIILGASSLLSCLPLEPIPGSSIWYNFCSNPIELRRDGVPEEIYQKKKKLVIDSGSSISGTFFPNKNTEKEAIKNYFIENGVKNVLKWICTITKNLTLSPVLKMPNPQAMATG